jgi:hypothetical protein
MGQTLDKQQERLVFGYVSPKYVNHRLFDERTRKGKSPADNSAVNPSGTTSNSSSTTFGDDPGVELDRNLLSKLGLVDDLKNAFDFEVQFETKESPKKKAKPILFGQLSSHIQIGLCSHGIIKLSPNIGLLKESKILQVCCNHLRSIPTEIGYMKNLTILSLSQNRLTSLPESIGFLTKLVELRCSLNSLSTLPKSIIALKKLAHLHLDSNCFATLIPEIGELSGLVTFDLSNNPLKLLPSEISKLKALRNLVLENCPLITEFESPSLFQNPITLKELCARVIVRYRLDIVNNLPTNISAYLQSVNECSFCGGPYFENYIVRGKFITRSTFVNQTTGEPIPIPLEYKLCSNHWATEEQRLKELFKPLPETAPPKSLSKSSSTSSLFNAFSDLNHIKQFQKQTEQLQSLIPNEPAPNRRRRSSTPNINMGPIEIVAPKPKLRTLFKSSSSKSLNVFDKDETPPDVVVPLISLTPEPSLPMLPTAKSLLKNSTSMPRSKSMNSLLFRQK